MKLSTEDIQLICTALQVVELNLRDGGLVDVPRGQREAVKLKCKDIRRRFSESITDYNARSIIVS